MTASSLRSIFEVAHSFSESHFEFWALVAPSAVSCELRTLYVPVTNSISSWKAVTVCLYVVDFVMRIYVCISLHNTICLAK